MIMKKSLTMALTVVAATAMLFVTGCNKSDNPVGTSGGLSDQNLVGVWWVTSGLGGTQILADGTALPLTAYAGKIAVDTVAAKQYSAKITASSGTGTYTETSKSSSTGKDTTTNHPFTYVLSNSNNSLTVIQNNDAGKPDTTAYTRKNIGDASSGGGTTSNTLSVTFDGTAYTMTAYVEAFHDTLVIYGVTLSGQSCQITVKNQLGTQTVGTSIASVAFVLNSTTYYGSSAGAITVTTVSGTNTQGSFSVTMTGSTGNKSASGSFNVTR
jgi:hypothetical protein